MKLGIQAVYSDTVYQVAVCPARFHAESFAFVVASTVLVRLIPEVTLLLTADSSDLRSEVRLASRD